MKFIYKTIEFSKIKNSWCPRFLYIQEAISRGETLDTDIVTPQLALGYVGLVLKRVPELELIIIKSTSGIRSDYIKLLKLIRES